MTRVAIIVLNWNSPHDTIRCIDSILSQEPTIPDIILVDNASDDDSVSIFRKYISQHDSTIHLIENATNRGFAGGINDGIDYCIDKKFDYIGMLNPDAIADKNWLSSLLAEFVNDSIGSATGYVLSADGSLIDTSGDLYTTWGIPEARDRNQDKTSINRPSGEVFGGTGGAVLYRSSTLQELKGFDERFFMYYEDVDLAFRARLLGYVCRFSPDAIVYHDRGSSSRKVPGLVSYQTFRNMPILFWKNVPRQLLLKMWPRFILAYHALLLHSLLRGNIHPLKGWISSILQTPHTIKERWRIQRSVKAPINDISISLTYGLPQEQTGLRKLFRQDI